MALISERIRAEDQVGLSGDGLIRQDRSLQHDVYAVLVDWIHKGELRPGDRVNEAAIARHLGVSRGPVREAISRLDYEGLVIRRPRRGALVAEFTSKDLEEIAAVRQLIEGHAARSACQRVTPQDLAELEKLVVAMKTAAECGQWTETALLNGHFHQTVLRISGNKILCKMWQTLHPLVWLLAPAAAAAPHGPHDAESIEVRHQALCDALRAGAPDRAEAAFRQHVFQATRWPIAQSRATGSATEVIARGKGGT